MKGSKMKNRYIIKEAAGIFWLIDVCQEGFFYREPLQMNAIGADIFRMWEKKLSVDKIIDVLCEEYDAPRDVIASDVQEFLERLKSYMERTAEDKTDRNVVGRA